MYKKKIAGIIIFAVVLVVFIGYPNMVENWEQRRMESMLKNERYEEVYEALSKERQDADSWEYFALMRSEYYLGHLSRFNIRLTTLINNHEKDKVQLLVDEFGMDLSDHFIAIDQMGGIEFKDEEVREGVAVEYFNAWQGYGNHFFGFGNPETLRRAREVRGEKDELDMIDIYYYAAMKDMETLVNLHDEIPGHLRENYYEIVTVGIISPLISHEVNTDTTSHFNLLESLDFPDELLKKVGFYASSSVQYSPADPSFLQEPFFKDNIYLSYYLSLRKLNLNHSRKEGLSELNEREEYLSIDGSREILDVVNNGRLISNFLEISKDGYLLYKLDEVTYSVNLFGMGNVRELAYGETGVVSNNRSYYTTLIWDAMPHGYKILDSSFNVVETIQYTDYIKWVDDNKLFYAVDSGWLYDIKTKTKVPTRRSEVEFPTMDIYDPSSKLYSWGEETYTAIEQDPVQGNFYRVRNIKDHSIVYEMHLGEISFLGSCDRFVYTFETLDSLQILMGIDKDTREKIYFPFYKLKDQWIYDYVNYLYVG